MVEANRIRIISVALVICFCVLLPVGTVKFPTDVKAEEKAESSLQRYYIRREYLGFKPESACVYFFQQFTFQASACSSSFLSGSAGLPVDSGDSQAENRHAGMNDTMYYVVFPMNQSVLSDNALALFVYYAAGQALYSPAVSGINKEHIFNSSSIDFLAKNMIKIERERLEVMDQTRQVELDTTDFMNRVGKSKDGAKLLQLNENKTGLLREIANLEYNQGRFTELIARSREKDSPIQQANQLRKRDLALAVKQVVEQAVRRVDPGVQR